MQRRVWIFTAVIAATLAILCWTGWMAYDTADIIASRLSSKSFESLRFGDTFAADLHELRSHFRRFEATRDDAHWQNFERAWERLDGSLATQQQNAAEHEEKGVIANLRANLQDYMKTSRRAHQRMQAGSSPLMLAPDIIALGDQAAEMAADIRRLIAARQDSIERTLAVARARLASLTRIMATTLAATVILAVVLALVVWRGMIQPLRTQLIASEDIARRSEKLAALGVLAAGVAHEVRNPLTAIKARLFIQEKRLPPASPALDDARIIEREIHRLESTVRTVLAFANPARPHPAKLNPAATLEQVAALMIPECEKRGIRFSLAPSTPLTIRVDAAQLHQVLLNLARNAMEAVGPGGNVTARALQGIRQFGNRETHCALLEIEDDGPGISNKARPRLFEPFFTTKSDGTGLGLAISARIVESNGGQLEFASHPGRGTVFRVMFPCAA